MFITSYNEYLNNISEANEANELNEAYLVAKRRNGNKPAEYISSNAPVRTKVLSFISEKESGKVSKKELMEFFETLQEELGKKPSWGWLSKNAQYIDKEIDENGDQYYSLTKRGKRVLEVLKSYEKVEIKETSEEE